MKREMGYKGKKKTPPALFKLELDIILIVLN